MHTYTILLFNKRIKCSSNIIVFYFPPILNNAAYIEENATELGYSKVIYLGEGQSFDVSNYAGYQDFTIDNFIIELSPNATLNATTGNAPVDHNYTSGNYGVGYSTTVIKKEYDNQSGILTAYIQQTARVALCYGSASNKTIKQIVKCYLFL